MTETVSLYVFTGGGTEISEKEIFMIRALAKETDFVYLICQSIKTKNPLFKQVESLATVVIKNDSVKSIGTGIAVALPAIAKDMKGRPYNILVSNSDVYGPLGSISDFIKIAEEKDSDIIAPYFHNLVADPRVSNAKDDEKLPYLDFTIFKNNVVQSKEFIGFFKSGIRSSDYWDEFINVVRELFSTLDEAGFKTDYFIDPVEL